MSVSARAALRARTPDVYLRAGFCGPEGKIRPELLDAEAIAVTTQLAATEASPQELAFTLEALRALLPIQQGAANVRIHDGLAESLGTVARMIRQPNNKGIIQWCRACAAFVRTEADIAAFLEHMRAVLRLYALIASLPPPVPMPMASAGAVSSLSAQPA
jgi:hypothetical protein